CEVGQAKITKAYNLNAKYVIHTVGPVWHGGNRNEEELLADCYRNSLAIAKEYNIKSIAFPIISSGTSGYPKDRALETAISVIGDFLIENDMDIFLVVYDKETFGISEKLSSSIKHYIDENYIEENDLKSDSFYNLEEMSVYELQRRYASSLDDVLAHLDETFSETLLSLIDKRKMTDVEAYKTANVSGKLFSKIRSNKDYHPSKSTALAFAIALNLNLDETRDLLLRAGFALSNSSKVDVIVRYFIEKRNYDIFNVNIVLFDRNQKQLGGRMYAE
ncbi:MAG: macro domain-containing protein, partial [Peptostreptococcaceae bacterium]|nr:macro domain-containing protein [Peptostreptococcaceae bacterium]